MDPFEQLNQPVLTPQEVAQEAQPEEKPEGFFSQAGEFIDTIMGGYGDERLGAQLEADKAKAIEEDNFMREIDANIGSAVNAVLGGASDAFNLLPHLGARLTGQSAEFNNRPASILDDEPVSEILYDLAKVLTPSIILAPVTGGMSLPAGLALESAIETIPQDEASDLIAGQTVATKFGELYDAYGLDLGYENGAALTKDMMEGGTIKAQALLGLVGFAQNFGINFGMNRLLSLYPKAKEFFFRDADRIAQATGRNVEDVKQSLTDFVEPKGSPDLEPSSTATLGTISPSLKSETGINYDGLLQRALNDTKNLAEERVLPAEFFSDWDALMTDPDPQAALRNAMNKLKPLPLGADDKLKVEVKTIEWLRDNMSLLDTDAQEFLVKFIEDFGSETDTITKGGRWSMNAIARLKDMDDYIRKYIRLDIGDVSANYQGIVGVAVSRYLSEDLGNRLMKASGQLDEMLLRNEDITDYMNNVYLPLEQFTQTILFPFRRAKRAWYLSGEAQQKAFAGLDMGADAPVKDMERLIVDGNPTPNTIRDLWTKAQRGDKDAFKVLKSYIKTMRYGDPATVLSNSQIVTDTITEQLKKKGANEKGFYNILMLGQMITQVNAAAPTIYRQALEPLALSGAFGSTLSKEERMFGLGQFVVGARYVGHSMKAIGRALATDRPAAGYAKYTNKYHKPLVKEMQNIHRLHLRRQKELLDNGASIFEMLSEKWWHFYQLAMYHPTVNLPTRGLMATDEGARVTAGTQIAGGRAYVKAMGQNLNAKQMQDLINKEIAEIFDGPPHLAKIKDPEVKAIADKITMQTPIKSTDDDLTFIERYFAAEAEAAAKDPIHRFFNPFARVAGIQLNQELENSIGLLPFLGKKGLKNMPYVEKYRKLYEASDPAQKLQLEAQLSLVQWTTMSAMASILFGTKITGSLDPTNPNSVIVPAPWTTKGEVAFNYSKFVPSMNGVNLLANLVQEYSEGAISHGKYAEGVVNLMYGQAVQGLKRSVLQGQQQLQKLLDFQNEGYPSKVADVMSSFLTPGFGRELGEIINPYQTISTDRTSLGNEIASGFAEKGVRSFYSPKAADIYAKTKADADQTRVPVARDANGIQRRLAVLLSKLTGVNPTEVNYNDPVMTAMRTFKVKPERSFLTRIYNAELTKDQQAILRSEMAGVLYPALNKYITGRYQRDLKRYQDALAEHGAYSVQANKSYATIQNKLRSIHNEVKLSVLGRSDLRKDPVLKEAIEKSRMEISSSEALPERQGLYATAAQQNTQLASQVKAILDIA